MVYHICCRYIHAITLAFAFLASKVPVICARGYIKYRRTRQNVYKNKNRYDKKLCKIEKSNEKKKKVYISRDLKKSGCFDNEYRCSVTI